MSEKSKIIIIKGSPLPFLSMFFFFSLWGIYSAVGFNYHDNVVAAMFLPWLLLAWDKHDLKLFITFSVFMIIGKENISIWLIFIGISLLITGRKDTLTFYLWNRGNNPVDFYEFTLVKRK